MLLFCLQLIAFPRYFVAYISSRLVSTKYYFITSNAIFSIQQIWRLFSILLLPFRTIVFPLNFVPYSNMVSILSLSSYKTISYWRVDGSGLNLKAWYLSESLYLKFFLLPFYHLSFSIGYHQVRKSLSFCVFLCPLNKNGIIKSCQDLCLTKFVSQTSWSFVLYALQFAFGQNHLQDSSHQ